MTETCKELIWLKNFLKELDKEQMTPSLHSENHGAINLVNNPVFHDRTKHIDVRLPLHPHSFEGRCVIPGEDPHESESHRHLTKVVTVEKLKTCSVSMDLLGEDPELSRNKCHYELRARVQERQVSLL